ncbi:MAG TPA: dihydroneopterin aldolase [Candidatus Acidoferrales bacterium]|nr:dihydroneopterin aldolase [Candidatus Acidoferrales bacterium]
MRGIRAYGRHGADPGERDRAQAFDIDVELEADLTAARHSDALADTVDYAAVHERIVNIVEQTSFELLERLGEELLRMLLEDRRIAGARVTIGKPLLLHGATPSVTLSAVQPR